MGILTLGNRPVSAGVAIAVGGCVGMAGAAALGLLGLAVLRGTAGPGSQSVGLLAMSATLAIVYSGILGSVLGIVGGAIAWLLRARASCATLVLSFAAVGGVCAALVGNAVPSPSLLEMGYSGLLGAVAFGGAVSGAAVAKLVACSTGPR